MQKTLHNFTPKMRLNQLKLSCGSLSPNFVKEPCSAVSAKAGVVSMTRPATADDKLSQCNLGRGEIYTCIGALEIRMKSDGMFVRLFILCKILFAKESFDSLVTTNAN
jgi:hypothetical protein